MSSTTHEAPERIWAKPPICWCGDRAKMSGGTEYVRADLVQAAVAAKLREAAAAIQGDEMLSPIGAHRVSARILALITPDAQAALDRVVAAERERGFWAGRSCGGSKAEIDAALAAIREEG